jgi:dTDP-4-dehydrorhamnose reductase
MVDKAEEDKELCFNTNTIGVKNLSQLSAILDVPLIHISTDYVFDGIRNTPYKETDTPIPINYYGETKLQGEKMFLEHAKTGVLIRTSWLYSEFNNNFLKTILNLSKIKKELQVIYDQIGTPTYTRDLTLIIKEIIPKIKKNKKEIYHFSNEGTASWYDFAHEIVTLCKYDCIVQPIKTENYSSKARRPKFSVLDKEKIKNELNIEIRHWKEALKECIKNLY